MRKKQTSERKIKESLLAQLGAQNKETDYFRDLVDTYMAHWRLKQKLIKDVEENGLSVEVVNGNGIKSKKPNPSIADMQKETTIMLQILDKMDLKTPVPTAPAADPADDYL